MSVDALLEIVRGHVAVDDRERESLRVFRETVVGLDDPCNEHADPVHVTASALVVAPRGTVLHLHKRLNMWLQPGGHIEHGEDPPTAALREATEETGLVVAHPVAGPLFFHVDVHPGPRGHTHLDLRYLLVADGSCDPAPGAGESPHVRWFTWDEAAAVADAGLAGAVVRARELALGPA
jgi:8-oxo-dGTP pyrophosphatase MutT (NUDIX family)